MFTIRDLLFLVTLLLSFPLSLSWADGTQVISTKDAVIFNTLCARCHEGECSGRLSLDIGSQAASNHILRYSGATAISKAETKAFFTLLNHMKRACSLWMPEDKDRKKQELSYFALPSSKGYFIPLGLLREGKYDIKITLDDTVEYRLELLSARFDHFLDISAHSDGKKQDLEFTIDEAVHTFLRIQSRNTFEMVELKVINKEKELTFQIP